MTRSSNIGLCVALSLLVPTAGITGCASIGRSESRPALERLLIEDRSWQLETVTTHTAGPLPASGAWIRLNSSDKRASGNTGVNQFGGTYMLLGSDLTFGPQVMTRRAGPPELMQQESAFMRSLELTRSVRRGSNGNLELLGEDRNVLASFVSAEGPK
jgi:heat shock protein HslJ